MSDFTDCVRCEKSIVAYLPKVSLGDNCRECGKYAFSFDRPAFLYLIFNEQLGEYKIGFGKMGKSRDRLKRDIEAGWSVLALWHTADKKRALTWEREVFKSSWSDPRIPELQDFERNSSLSSRNLRDSVSIVYEFLIEPRLFPIFHKGRCFWLVEGISDVAQI